MKTNKLTVPFQKPPGILEFLIVPVLGLGALMWIDTYYITGAFTLPFLLMLVLGFLAFRLPLWAVLVWALIYSGIIMALMIFDAAEAITLPVFRPYLWGATFLAGGIIASLLAGHRARLEKSYNALFKVVSNLPLPVIVSDISGTILLMNLEAGKLLDEPANELAGLSFFSTFSSPDDQGQSISKYLRYFDRNLPGPHKLILHTRGKTKHSLAATLSVVGTANQLLAVTVIESVNQSRGRELKSMTRESGRMSPHDLSCSTSASSESPNH